MGLKFQKMKKKKETDWNDIDNVFELIGFLVTKILANWQKVLLVILTIGVVLLLLLPHYECSYNGKDFKKGSVKIKEISKTEVYK